MTRIGRCRVRIAAVLGVGIGIVSYQERETAAFAQNPTAPAAVPSESAVERVVARLKEACATKPELLGVLVQGGEVAGGVLRLSGTRDRKEQAAAIEAETARIANGEPSWKTLVPNGVSAAGMPVLPVRSQILSKLQGDFAATSQDAEGRPGGLLRQTRLDDISFDPAGHLKIVGICVNHQAYLDSQKKEGADQGLDPCGAQVAQGCADRLKTYPLPDGVDPDVLGRVQAEGIQIKEDPARRLQALVAEAAGYDDVVFLDSRFDARGALVVEGLIGAAEQRPAIAALVSRRDFAQTYARPGGESPTNPATAVASLAVLPWGRPLVAGIQERFARPSNKGTDQEDLRYCRVDRARFGYRDQGGLQLRFDGIALIDDDPAASTRILQALRDESGRLFQPPRPVEYNVVNDLKLISNPRRALQAKVASEPTVDGVRIDDLTIGPKGEPTLEGVWVGAAQAAPVDALLQPFLAARTNGKVAGSLVHHFTAVPVDQILRDLRVKTAAVLDETSLDRLSYQFVDETSPAVPTLMGATPASRLQEVSAKLADWLQADQRTAALGPPEVKLAIIGQPGSLLNELRTRVSRQLPLDGVRIDRAVFDESNVLTLSGRQDHANQADQALALVPAAAAKVWPSRRLPLPVRSGVFTIIPLAPRLERLRRALPFYREADGVLLSRAYYRPDGALTFDGRNTGSAGERPGLENLVKSLIDVNPKEEVKLNLQTQPRDPIKASWLLTRYIDLLAKNSVSTVPIEELDELIFLDPDNSTSWYLRAAYYQTVGDRELMARDLGRVKRFETNGPGRSTASASAGSRVSRSRIALDELEASTPTAR